MLVNKRLLCTGLGSVILLLAAGMARGQEPTPAGSTGTTAAPKCTWKVERIVVVKAQVTDRERKAVDEALDALVKAVGAAASEVKALKKALDELGPGGDLVDVDVICACEDAAGNVVKREKRSVGSNDTFHWAAKTNKLMGQAKEDNERAQKRIV